METLILSVLLITVLYFFIKNFFKRKSRSSYIKGTDREYPYTIGDDLIQYTSVSSYMRGIDIELPKEFPHIYIDGHASDKFRGPRYYFDKSNMLSLEGNFDTSFQVYAPKNYETLALSILSPDVMAVLVDNANKYDIELFGSHLRIISNKKIFNKHEDESDIIRVAGIVLHEIEHRLKSWNPHDSRNAHIMLLKMYDEQTLKFAGKYIRITTIAAFIMTLSISTLFYGMAIFLRRNSMNEAVWLFVALGFICFPTLFLGLILENRSKQFKQR